MPQSQVEGGQPEAGRDRRARFRPPETAGNHQVDDEEQVPLDAPYDAFAEATQPLDPTTVQGRHRRRDRVDQERTRDPGALEPRALEPRPERVQVEFDIRQFRHTSL